MSHSTPGGLGLTRLATSRGFAARRRASRSWNAWAIVPGSALSSLRLATVLTALSSGSVWMGPRGLDGVDERAPGAHVVGGLAEPSSGLDQLVSLVEGYFHPSGPQVTS